MGHKKFSLNISLLVSFFLFLSLLVPGFSSLNAASPKKKLTEIQKQIKKKKKKVKEVIKKEKSILSRIENIERNIKKKRKELRQFDKRISQTQSNITNLSKDINSLKTKLLKSKRYLKKRLKVLYKQHYGDNALLLISARDYQDLIRKSKYISLVAHHDTKVMKNYSRKINDINFKKRKMEVLRGKLETSKNNAKKRKKLLQNDRKKKGRLLATVRSKRSTYEKTISELEKSSKKLRQMIKRLEKRRVPKSVIGKGLRASRGHLPWPVNGKVLIPFGKYKDRKFNIPVFKNGIEIKAKPGANPKAVHGGRVVYSDWFKGYGLLLIINHGNGYHSLYGNLSEIFHKTGDIINKGTAIGKVGESRLMNVSTLYFEIRYKGKPVDPRIWLKRKGKIKRRAKKTRK
jgi:septal ring factor EnvC (AmiA/AmiB activator)